MVVDVIVVMEVIIAVVLSLSSLFFVAVVAIASVLADAVIAVAMMTAVASSGSYLSFSSAAAMALADAEIPAANLICKSHRRRCVPTPFSYFFHFYNKCGE